jgi:uncharacterized protein
MGSTLVAFSGGTDSAFLLTVAAKVLKKKAVAATALSPIRPRAEMSRAKRIAKKLKVEHRIVRSGELKNTTVAYNRRRRCYACKRLLFGGLRKLAGRLGLATVCDASHVDDLAAYRPGQKAIAELGIRSPLREAGFRKSEIRRVSRSFGIDTWNAPSQSCLLTRFPYDHRITAAELAKVGGAEEYLHRLGFTGVRVRAHGTIVRLELGNDAATFRAARKASEKIVRRFKKLGFHHVTLDLEGYRSGSMDRALALKRWIE